jgi:hypothetical protein
LDLIGGKYNVISAFAKHIRAMQGALHHEALKIGLPEPPNMILLSISFLVLFRHRF